VVEAQTVNDDEEHLPALFQQWRHAFGHNIHRHGRRVLLAGDPRGVVALHEAAELVIALLALVFDHLRQSAVADLTDLDIPLRQQAMHVDPRSPRHVAGQPFTDLIRLRHEGLACLALPDLLGVEDLLAGHQDLARIDRFRQIVIDTSPDGLVHQVFFFALGDHDDWHVRVAPLQLLQRRQSVETGHHLIEQDEVEVFLLQ